MMNIMVKLTEPILWYRECTKEWVISLDILTDNMKKSINFSAKKKNVVKKKFFNYFTKEGILCEEMSYLFANHKISIHEYTPSI